MKTDERKCESCDKVFECEKMHLDEEGLWFCEDCWQAATESFGKLYGHNGGESQ